jgi:hypothetical protein
LQQQQQSRNDPQHLPCAQQLPVESEFIADGGGFKVKSKSLLLNNICGRGELCS